jgi:tetratricopeptide (TPR) repeat protein
MAKTGADALLRTATQLYRDGKLVEAERMFRAVLQALGEETNALAYLSLIALDRGAKDDALDYGQRAVSADSTNPAAHHHMGLAHHAMGDFIQAANAIGRAVELAPGHLGALNMFARSLLQSGALGMAVQAYRKLVSLNPRDAAVAFEAAVALQEAGIVEEAAFLYCRCLCAEPAALEVWTNLGMCGASPELAVHFHSRAYALAPNRIEIAGNFGNALGHAGYRQAAIALLTKVMEAAPHAPQTHFNLGAAIGAVEPGRSMAHYAMAIVLAPNFGNPWINAGGQMVRDRRFYMAARAYHRAMVLEPLADRPRMNCALALMYAGEINAPASIFADSLVLHRASAFWPFQLNAAPYVPDDPTYQVTNALKLRHDVEQLRYLRERELISAELHQAIVRLDEIRTEIEGMHGPATVGLPPNVREAIGGVYNRVIYWRPTPALDTSPISSDFDRAAVNAQYAEPPGITVVDGLLTDHALAELRAFCLESTIWFDLSHNFTGPNVDGPTRGYLGALVTDGFSCPLLFQIAEEMRKALPDIFRDYPLMQMWAYKGDQSLQALEAHADAAAVNVNFWITPDDANLDPDSGGLTVWTAEAPADWNFDKFNNDKSALMDLTQAPGVRRIDVPYRQNRALIFNSDLIHASQPVSFKPGFENRRINITMLFGTRDRDWQRLSS